MVYQRLELPNQTDGGPDVFYGVKGTKELFEAINLFDVEMLSLLLRVVANTRIQNFK